MDAEKIFLDYAGRYDRSCGMIELKIVHTLGVARVMDRLAASLRLDARMTELAHICAVFHDIGRFEQVRRYGTFYDAKSVNHAALGVEVLKEEKILADLPKEDRQMVLTAIANHNRFRIEEGLDEETLLLAKLIRDADKCDIFRVFAQEDMVDTMGETVEQVERETVTDHVYDTFFAHRCILHEERSTGLDKWITFLGFFFDLNFRESFVVLRECPYYRQPFDAAHFADPETEKRVRRILAEAERYIDLRLTE